MSDDPFLDYVAELHAEKHAVYGDSWKRRGEQVAILANIARKVDRLGVAGAGDTSADTAVDLLVYLLKYRLWLTDERAERLPVGFRGHRPVGDGPASVERLLRSLSAGGIFPPIEELVHHEKVTFEKLLVLVGADVSHPRRFLVDSMISYAVPLARVLWWREQG